jgi:hypothetical protein
MTNSIRARVVLIQILTQSYLKHNVMYVQQAISVLQVLTDLSFVQMVIIVQQEQKTISNNLALQAHTLRQEVFQM